MGRRPRPESLLLLFALALFALMAFKHLSYPLLWQDEGETAMYGLRVLEYRYPKVRGERNVVYEFGTNAAQGVKERYDAYIGTTWGHFYFAVPGLLWAERTDDLYAKTRRLRLPFALAGAAGLLLMLLGVAPVFRDRPRRTRLFAALYCLGVATSVSLLLHLREMRYYGLLLLLAGAILLVHLRYAVFRSLRSGPYALLLTPLLVLLFNVFYAAFFAVTALLALERVAATRAAADASERRRALAGLVPLLAAAVCVAPLVVFFETFAVAGALSRELGLSLGVWAENLQRVAAHFLRHELLAAALGARAVALFAAGRLRRADPTAGRSADRRVANLLSLAVVGYAAIACVNPLIYERYFVVLSPLVTLVFLLDAFWLAETLPHLAPPARRARVHALAIGTLALLAASSCAARWDEIRGRLTEIATPYRGPLDFAIPYLKSRHPRSEELVIATNYENHPLMYYLGSHVIVGTTLSNIARERMLEPDVVLPRRHWKRGLAELRRFLERGEFARKTFPVPDLHFNNNPALSSSPQLPDPHRFRSAVPGHDTDRLELFERLAPDSAGRGS
jgi:hypothetical protein